MSYENMRQTTDQLNIMSMSNQDDKPDDNSDQYDHDNNLPRGPHTFDFYVFFFNSNIT